MAIVAAIPLVSCPGVLVPDTQDRGGALHALRRIGLPFALALLAGVAVISYRTVVQFRNDVEWRSHTHQVLEHIERANTALLGADSLRRAYRLSRDRRDLDEMQGRIDVSTRELATIEALTADNLSQQQRLRELRPVVAERLEVLHDGLELPSWDQLDAKTREEQRVRQSHGELTIDSNALGTRITATFPVTMHAPNEPVTISRHGNA